MKNKKILLLAIVLFVGLMVFSYLNSFAQTAARSNDSEQEIISRLDSILENQSTILQRLNVIEQEIKNRCRI